jgi:hypothetical protein
MIADSISSSTRSCLLSMPNEIGTTASRNPVGAVSGASFAMIAFVISVRCAFGEAAVEGVAHFFQPFTT